MRKLVQLSLQEICQNCGLEEESLHTLIREEWIVPLDPQNLLFDEEDLARLTLIQELRSEFGVNDEGVPIILDLIDQIHYLRSQLDRWSRKYQ